MGVKEQASHVASLVYSELNDKVEDLHSELHALSTRMGDGGSVMALLADLVARVEALESAVSAPPKTGRARTAGS